MGDHPLRAGQQRPRTPALPDLARRDRRSCQNVVAVGTTVSRPRPRRSRTNSRACRLSGARRWPSRVPARRDGGCPPGSAISASSAAAAGAAADQIQDLLALAELGREAMLEQHDEGPYLRASSAQMSPADSVTEAPDPVSVTIARWPGGTVTVVQTRRCATPSRAKPARYRQNGSSTISSPSGGRSAGEAGVSEATSSPPGAAAQASRHLTNSAI